MLRENLNDVAAGYKTWLTRTEGLLTTVGSLATLIGSIAAAMTNPAVAAGLLVLLLATLVFAVVRAIQLRHTVHRPIRTDVPTSAHPLFRSVSSFREEDASVFSGRVSEITYVTGLLRTNPLKVLYVTGKSGVGKTSLIRAGVRPQLGADWNSIYVEKPTQDPIRALQSVRASTSRAKASQEEEESSALAHSHKWLSKDQKRKLLVIFDHFEKYFIQTPSTEMRAELGRRLVEEVFRPNLASQIRMIICIRSDFADEINDLGFAQLSAQTPNLWSGTSRIRLDELSATAAKDLIVAARTNNEITFSDALVETMVSDIARENRVSPVVLQVLVQSIRQNNIATPEEYSQFGRAHGLIFEFVVAQFGLPPRAHRLHGADGAVRWLRLTLQALAEPNGISGSRTFDAVVAEVCSLSGLSAPTQAHAQAAANVKALLQMGVSNGILVEDDQKTAVGFAHDYVADVARQLSSELRGSSEKADRTLDFYLFLESQKRAFNVIPPFSLGHVLRHATLSKLEDAGAQKLVARSKFARGALAFVASLLMLLSLVSLDLWLGHPQVRVAIKSIDGSAPTGNASVKWFVANDRHWFMGTYSGSSASLVWSIRNGRLSRATDLPYSILRLREGANGWLLAEVKEQSGATQLQTMQIDSSGGVSKPIIVFRTARPDYDHVRWGSWESDDFGFDESGRIAYAMNTNGDIHIWPVGSSPVRVERNWQGVDVNSTNFQDPGPYELYTGIEPVHARIYFFRKGTGISYVLDDNQRRRTGHYEFNPPLGPNGEATRIPAWMSLELVARSPDAQESPDWISLGEEDTEVSLHVTLDGSDTRIRIPVPDHVQDPEYSTYDEDIEGKFRELKGTAEVAPDRSWAVVTLGARPIGYSHGKQPEREAIRVGAIVPLSFKEQGNRSVLAAIPTSDVISVSPNERELPRQLAWLPGPEDHIVAYDLSYDGEVERFDCWGRRIGQGFQLKKRFIKRESPTANWRESPAACVQVVEQLVREGSKGKYCWEGVLGVREWPRVGKLDTTSSDEIVGDDGKRLLLASNGAFEVNREYALWGLAPIPMRMLSIPWDASDCEDDLE